MADKPNAIFSETLATEPQEREKRPTKSLPAWVVALFVLLAIGNIGAAIFFKALVLPTGSMEDTLLIGDHFLVSQFAYSLTTPQHGDIIVFRYPADSRQVFVKRVIGVPGDHIKLVRGVVFRNGVKLNEPYSFRKGGYFQRVYDAYRDDFPAIGPNFDAGGYPPLMFELQHDLFSNHAANGEVVVPANNYFTLGDNRDNSFDSRYWGFVPGENIIGKPVMIYWSYQARTEDLAGPGFDSRVSHAADVAKHFFSRTRWSRTFQFVHGFPDADLPNHEIPINKGNPNP